MEFSRKSAGSNTASVTPSLGPYDRLWVGRATTRAEMDRQIAAYEAHGPITGVLELVLEREEMPPFAPFLKPDAPKVSARPPAFAIPAE